MGCVTSMAIALWLIALASGVMILYKVHKENLQWPFKLAGWFIIVIAIGGMFCCSLRCMMNACGGGGCERPWMMRMQHHKMRGWDRCMSDEKNCCGRNESCSKTSCDDDDECHHDAQNHSKKELRIIIDDSTTNARKK